MQQYYDEAPVADQASNDITNPSMYSSLDPELIRYILDPDPLLQRLVLKLSRIRFNKETKSFVRVGDPLCNDEGINNLLSLLDVSSDKGVVLSNFQQEDIYRKMRRIGFTIVTEMVLNKERYEIREENMDLIFQMLMETAEAALRRAYKGDALKKLTGTMQRTEQVHTQAKGGWSLFKRR